MNAIPLNWQRDGYRYRATDAEGSRWHIVQATSRRWSVYRNGSHYTDAVTLTDAKWYAEEEADPEARERRRVRTLKRRAIQAARKGES